VEQKRIAWAERAYKGLLPLLPQTMNSVEQVKAIYIKARRPFVAMPLLCSCLRVRCSVATRRWSISLPLVVG
jgi:hypothetical protein